MNECTIITCHERATQEGELSAVGGKHAYPVRYCDEHAKVQEERVAEHGGLVLNLSTIPWF